MSVAGIVLAAGFSRRLGRPKQTVVIGGESLIERTVRVARDAGLHPLFIVVNSEAQFAEALRDAGCRVIVNEKATEGMASSIRAGVQVAQATPECVGVVIMTCDQPAIEADHLRALRAQVNRVTGSGYAGRVAVPAYFPRGSFDSLVALEGDAGARGLLEEAHAVPSTALRIDVDTDEDVARARLLFEHDAVPEPRGI